MSRPDAAPGGERLQEQFPLRPHHLQEGDRKHIKY